MKLPQILDRSDALFAEIYADRKRHLELIKELAKHGVEAHRTWRYEIEGDRIKCFEYHYTDDRVPHVESECPDNLHEDPSRSDVCSVVVYR